MGGAIEIIIPEALLSGIYKGRRHKLNFIPGIGIALAVAEDAANDRINITVTNSGDAAAFAAEHNGDGTHNALTKVTDPYIDIRKNGAAHNADSGAAINATIAEAVTKGMSTVLIPDKTFIIETSVIPDNRIRLLGMGPNSILKAKDGLNAPVIGGTAKDSVTLENFKIDGNQANQTTPAAKGISLNACTKAKIKDMHLTACYGHAIWAYGGCSKLKIYDNDIYDTGVANANPPRGIYVYQSYAPIIRGNHIIAVNGFGITAQETPEVLIEANNIEDSVNYDGMIIYNCESVTVLGNTIKNVKDSGIVFELCYDFTAVGNTIKRAGYVGMYLAGSSYGTVQGNVFKDNGQNNHASYCHDIIFTSSGAVHSLHNTITGNTLRATAAIKAKYGIQETSANHDYNIVKNNQLVGHTVAGVSMAGANSLAADNK